MGTIPTYSSYTTLEYLSSTKLNADRDAGNFWAKTPRCYAYQSTAQTLTTGVWTAINLQSENYDIVQSGDTAAHDNTTNNSRIYIRTTGIYELSGQVQFVANATAYRMARICLNGPSTILNEQHQGAAPTVSTSVGLIPIEVSLTAGDYVELYGYQASGGNLDTIVGSPYTFLRIRLTASP